MRLKSFGLAAAIGLASTLGPIGGTVKMKEIGERSVKIRGRRLRKKRQKRHGSNGEGGDHGQALDPVARSATLMSQEKNESVMSVETFVGARETIAQLVQSGRADQMLTKLKQELTDQLAAFIENEPDAKNFISTIVRRWDANE